MSVVYVSAFPPAGLVGGLEDRGLCVELSADECGCGRDHRLHVRAPAGSVEAELLGPIAGLLDLPCWHAVRVSNGDRAVWCGPPRMCDGASLGRFVADLVELPTNELIRRWQRLG